MNDDHRPSSNIFFPLCTVFRDNQTPRSLAKSGIIISILDEGPDHEEKNSGFESHDYGAENSDDSD